MLDHPDYDVMMEGNVMSVLIEHGEFVHLWLCKKKMVFTIKCILHVLLLASYVLDNCKLWKIFQADLTNNFTCACENCFGQI